MPTPRKGERRKPFMTRCVSEVIAEGEKTPAQAVAQCASVFENRKKTLKENVLDKLNEILDKVKEEDNEMHHKKKGK